MPTEFATTTPSIDVAQLAAQMAALLDQFQSLVPEYTVPDPARRYLVAQRARFGEQVIAPMSACSDNYPALRATNIFDAEAGRQALASRDAFRPIALRLAALSDAVYYTVDEKLAAAGTEALQAYQWSKTHLKFADANALKPYFDEAARVVKKTLGRKPKAQPSTPPVPPAPAGQTFMASRPAAPAEDADEEFEAMLLAAAAEEAHE